MVRWTESGYLDREVWRHFSSKINPAALPSNIETLQLPAAPGPLQLAFPVSIAVHISTLQTETFLSGEKIEGEMNGALS